MTFSGIPLYPVLYAMAIFGGFTTLIYVYLGLLALRRRTP